MIFKNSKFILIALLIYFIGLGVAKPQTDDDDNDETPSEGDKDSPKEKTPEENIEEAREKLKEEEEKIEEKLVSEIAPALASFADAEKDYVESVIDSFTTVQPPEGEEESPATPETKEEESEDEAPEMPIESTTTAPEVKTDEPIKVKEEAPKDTFAVWDKKKICLLAKFHATFSIMYSSPRGEQKAEVKLPKNAKSTGNCGSNEGLPLLKLSWGTYAFTMMFNKSDEEKWAVTSMELVYDTSEHLFDEAISPGKITARSKVVNLFETPLKNSYFCPGQEIILLYATNKQQTVTVRIRELQLQPYEVENGEFSTIQRCNKVVIDEETPYVQDETVPFAIGCTLALITLIILVGFSIHRAYHAAKVDYNSME